MVNIVELLKDCPAGTKLYSPLFGEVWFIKIKDNVIHVFSADGYKKKYDKYGRITVDEILSSECLLFPSKECRTWEDFKLSVEPKFKVGDWITDGICKVKITDINNTYYWFSKNCILGEIESIDKKYHLWSIEDAKDDDVLCTYEDGNPKIVFILRGNPEGNCSVLSYYCYYNIMYPHFESNAERGCLAPKRENVKPATKEQRKLLFQKMKEAGYEWDADKKELRKIKSHYDIANFYAGMPVLVRADNVCRWDYSVFSRITGNEDWQFAVCNGVSFTQCIPFNEETKHLLGTTNMCDEQYINWR